jgi:3,4-dihydroxy-2-butanone 4-phosphate synthase
MADASFIPTGAQLCDVTPMLDFRAAQGQNCVDPVSGWMRRGVGDGGSRVGLSAGLAVTSAAAHADTLINSGDAEVARLFTAARRSSRLRRAVEDVSAGRSVVVVDDDLREGALAFAAEHATPRLMAFMVRHCSGFINVALTVAGCDRLALPAMIAGPDGGCVTQFRVAVDARDGVTTGISAADRAHTARLLADPTACAGEFVRPGHVVPVAVHPAGVLEGGCFEAAVELCRLGHRAPAAVVCGIVAAYPARGMADRRELTRFAIEHGLALIAVTELRAYLRRYDCHVERVAQTQIPTAHGPFTAVGYRSGGEEHLALVFGGGEDGQDLRGRPRVLVRVHSECTLGDVFGSQHCGCGDRVAAALREIAASGCGVLIYLRDPRKKQLVGHLKHQVSQVTSRKITSMSVGERGIAVAMLADLGISSPRPPGTRYQEWAPSTDDKRHASI